MSKGRNLSYWQQFVSPGKQQTILLARATKDDPWMVVGIYDDQKVLDIYNQTYANWPKNCVEMIDLP